MAPWNGPPSSRPYDVLQMDAVLQFYPWRDMVFESWGRGQLPAWNPYELAGTPLLANSQSAALYPPHIIVGLLHIRTDVAITLLAWLHLFWAGLGVYFLSRRCGAIKTGATLAGAAFCLSPFMLSWTGLASVITTVSWIPWVLGLVLYLFQAGYTNPWKRSVLLSLCMAMMILAGHLQFAAYGILAAVMLLLFPLFYRKGFHEGEDFDSHKGARGSQLAYARAGARRYIAVVLAFAISFCIAAPQLFPVLGYSKFSHRANTPTPQGYQAYVAGAIPLFALQSIAFPTALGNPTNDYPLELPPQLKGASAYWPLYVHPGLNFAETAIGLGPLVFILLFCLRKLRGPAAGIALIGIIGLLLALGTILNYPLYFWMPGWSATGSPGRAIVLFVLAACVLGGVGFSHIQQLNPKALLGIIAVTGIIGLLIAMAPVAFGTQFDDPLRIDVNLSIKLILSGQALVFLLTLAIGATTLLFAAKDMRFKAAGPLAAVLCALIAYGWNLVPSGDNTIPRTPDDPNARHAFVNHIWGLFAPAPAIMPPNTAAISRMHDVGGYDSLLHRDTVAFLHQVDQDDPAPRANGNMMLVKPTAEPNKLADAGVTEVWVGREQPNLGSPLGTEAGVYRYALPSSGRAYTPSGIARITEEGYDRLKLSATGPGPLILKDRNMPGWTARVDGKQTEIKPGFWRELDLLPGPHAVLFTYHPPGFRNGMILAVIAGLLCLVILAPWALRRK